MDLALHHPDWARQAFWRRHRHRRPGAQARPSRSALRTRAAAPWPGIHGYSCQHSAQIKCPDRPQLMIAISGRAGPARSSCMHRQGPAPPPTDLSKASRSLPASSISTMRSTPFEPMTVGHADIHVLHAVFAVEIGRAGQHTLFVAQIALGHRDRRSGRRVESRSSLQEVDDLGAAVAGAVDDFIDPGLRGPAHLDQIGQGNAGHGGIFGEGTMVSPWPPSTKAVTSSTETLNSSARK